MAELGRLLRPEPRQLGLALVPIVTIASASVGLAWLGGPLLVALLGATAGSALPTGTLDRLPAALPKPQTEPAPLQDLIANDAMLVALVLGLSGLAALRGLAQYAQASATERLQQGAMARVRGRLFQAILSADGRALARTTPAEIAARIAGDVQRLESLVGGGALSALTHGLTLAVLATFAFTLDPVIAALAVLSLPPVGALGYWLSRRARASSEAALGAHARLARAVGEAAEGVPEFRRAGAARWITGRLEALAHGSRDAMLEAASARAVLGPAMGFAASVAFALTLLAARERIRLGLLTTEATGSLVVALLLLVRPMNALGTLAGTLSQGIAALRRIGALLTELEADRRDLAASEKRPFEALTLDQVSVTLGGAAVLRDVTLTIRRGETVAIVGPNGGGKTTLLQVMLGHLSPTAGRVRARIAGTDAAPDEVAAGWVPGDPTVVPGTLRENVALGRKETVPLEAVLERAELVVGGAGPFGGLDAPLPDGARGLSLGEKQRVALARALYGNPEVLLLDEPTAHLDDDASRAVERLIVGRTAEQTFVVVSHRPETIRLADRVIRVDGGRVVADDRASARALSAGAPSPGSPP